MSFVTFYILISTILVASTIRIFNASLVESSELDATEIKLHKLGTLETIKESLGYDTSEVYSRAENGTQSPRDGIRHSDLILGILTHVGVLDQHRDIEPWLRVSFLSLLFHLILLGD